MKKFTPGILCGLLTLFSIDAIAQNVWTQHNDQGRTGWYPYETTLDTSNVNRNTFGLFTTETTDDKVMSQPLVVMHVNIPGHGFKNVVYVTTLNNTIYAYDADVLGAPYWQQNYSNIINPAPGPLCAGNNCRPAFWNDIHPSLCGGTYFDFNGNMGIVGTPVIDTLRGIMYFVSKIVNPNDGTIDNHPFQNGIKDEYRYTNTGFHQYLHAIDITTGIDRPNSPVEIAATATGTGDGQTDATAANGFHGTTNIIKFNPRRQINRAGLVLNNGILYIAFGAHCDMNPAHGWIMSFDTATLLVTHSFITTPNDGRGGVWMSGTAPALDANGNIYFGTGNSLNETGPSTNYNIYHTDPSQNPNRGEGLVKLSPNLTLSDFFTPFDYQALNDADLDFGTQVMLIPNTNGLAMAGCKDDSIYVFNTNNMGGFDPFKNNTTQRVYVADNAFMHSTFGYFGGPTKYVYQYSEGSQLKAYPVSTSGLGPAITNTGIFGPTNGTGGFLSVSSNGGDPATGVLWAYQAENGCNANDIFHCPGVLHAVKANDIRSELWNSDLIPADQINVFNKMSCPTIALGKVYIGANENHLYVYSTKANTSCTTNQAIGQQATALTNQAAANNVTDGNLTTSWTSTATAPGNVDSIFVDLGVSVDICKILIIWSATGFGKDFDVKVSSDKTNWTVVKSFRGNTLTNTEFDGAVTGRYVSMVGITRGSSPYSINEFQIIGTPSVTCPPPANLVNLTGTDTTIFTTQIPTGTLADDNPVELGVQFQSTIPGFINGIRFYKTTGYFGTHIGELYDLNGVRMAAATFNGESATGWQTVKFATPQHIVANQTYTAAVYMQAGNYSAVINGLQTAVTNANLTANNVTNGVFTYGSAPVFPFNTFKFSNYWIDALFSQIGPPDVNTQNLSWDPVPGVSQYIIKYRPIVSESWIYRTSTLNSINLYALTCGTLYNYTIQANCGITQSVVSQGSFSPSPLSGSCPATGCDPTLTRWANLDLGDIGVAGSTCRHGTVYTLTGSGADIGGISDEFQYAFTSNDIADDEAYGEILNQDVVNLSNKIGIMVRDSITNTSRFAFLASTNNGSKFIFEYRSVAGGPTTTINIPGTFSLPYWAKIVKSGTSYTPFMSADNITWNQVSAPVNLNFGNNISNIPNYGMAITSANNTLLSSGQIDNFHFDLASSPLPIKLLSFTARDINHDHVLVSWATSMEHLVDHFEIQRSLDNSSFITIDQVKATGESEIPRYYSINDNNPAIGLNYYRLKELDKDGNFYYSPVVSVKFGELAGIEMYPNPANDYTTISSGKYPIQEVSVYDATGKLVKSIQPPAGQMTVQLNTADLLPAVYFVQVKTTAAIYRQKLFKQ